MTIMVSFGTAQSFFTLHFTPQTPLSPLHTALGFSAPTCATLDHTHLATQTAECRLNTDVNATPVYTLAKELRRLSPRHSTRFPLPSAVAIEPHVGREGEGERGKCKRDTVGVTDTAQRGRGGGDARGLFGNRLGYTGTLEKRCALL